MARSMDRSLVLVVLVCGCSSPAAPVAAAPASASVMPAPVTVPPASVSAAHETPPPPMASARVEPARCTDDLPPADMIRDNIASTAMSGLAEITLSKKTSLDGKSPAPTSGYIDFRYEVRVLRWFSGAGPDQLVLHQGAEAPLSPREPGQLLFFSACSLGPGEGSEPDVGYFFPLDPACRAAAEKLGESAAKRAGSKHKARACEHRK